MLDREKVGDGCAKNCVVGAGNCKFAMGFRGIDIMDRPLKGGDCRLTETELVGESEGAAMLIWLLVLS